MSDVCRREPGGYSVAFWASRVRDVGRVPPRSRRGFGPLRSWRRWCGMSDVCRREPGWLLGGVVGVAGAGCRTCAAENRGGCSVALWASLVRDVGREPPRSWRGFGLLRCGRRWCGMSDVCRREPGVVRSVAFWAAVVRDVGRVPPRTRGGSVCDVLGGGGAGCRTCAAEKLSTWRPGRRRRGRRWRRRPRVRSRIAPPTRRSRR